MENLEEPTPAQWVRREATVSSLREPESKSMFLFIIMKTDILLAVEVIPRVKSRVGHYHLLFADVVHAELEEW